LPVQEKQTLKSKSSFISVSFEAAFSVSFEAAFIFQNDAALVNLSLGIGPLCYSIPIYLRIMGVLLQRLFSLPISGSLKNYFPVSEYRGGIYYWQPFDIPLPTLTIIVHVGPGFEQLTGASLVRIIENYPQVATKGTILCYER
jgi:hypothetical protein